MEEEASNRAGNEPCGERSDEQSADAAADVKKEVEGNDQDGTKAPGETALPEASEAGSKPVAEAFGNSDLFRPSAEPAVASAVKPQLPARRLKSDLSTLDLAAGVLLLVILSLLVANSYVAYMGKNYNQRVCAESIALAGKAANEGLDTRHVQLAAYGSWEHCAFPGFFIEHPELIGFKDEITPAKDETPARRVITISSSTKVRVPAPFLIMDKDYLDKDDEAFQHITFKKTYQYQLTNPKGIQGKLIRGPGGRIIRLPLQDGAKGDKQAAPALKVDPSSIRNVPAAKPINLFYTPDAPATKEDASTSKPETKPQTTPGRLTLRYGDNVFLRACPNLDLVQGRRERSCAVDLGKAR